MVGVMAHQHPDYACFTREICRRGILREPFRLIDAGVRGGVGTHWLAFGDHLHLWGFGVLEKEGISPLIATNPHPDRFHYFNFGLGDEDGVRAFKFYPENPSSSHFAASNQTDRTDETWKEVPLRKLDSLYAEGVVGAVDFMKMDVESYEVEIVKGAHLFLSGSGIFGIESEASFLRTTRNPRSHFIELYESLMSYGFSVYDSGVHRVPREPLARGFPQYVGYGYLLRPLGRAKIFDFLFLNSEFDAGPPSQPDRLLKMIAVAEIYALHDVALDLLLRTDSTLGARLDIEEAANWLVRSSPAARLTYAQYRTATQVRGHLIRNSWIRGLSQLLRGRFWR
jgi:FkbM family methyltransferase